MSSGRDATAMRRAIEVGARHNPHPNPRVGAVLLDHSGEVLAEAGHVAAGEIHAEQALLEAFGRVPADATLVVTLEPCVHTGRTPPCVDAVIEYGVRRIVIGTIDPDSRVAGRGIDALRAAGIEVVVGVEPDAVEAADPGYFHHRRSGLPLVTLKQAATLDGQTAAADGTSKWLTSDIARMDSHRLRSVHDAVLVGAGTVRADDPRLDVRLPGYEGPQPVPVVVVGSRPLPADLRIWERHPIVLASDESVLPGLDVIRCGSAGVVDFKRGLAALGDRGLLTILVEGGAGVAAGLWEAGLVERGVYYLSAKIAGGMGRGAFDRVFTTLDDAIDVEITAITRVGPDIRIEWHRARSS